MDRNRIKKGPEYEYYVGIDPSLTSTGLFMSTAPGRLGISSLITSDPDDTIEDRIIGIWNEICTYIDLNLNRIAAVAIEGLAFGSQGQRKEQLSGLHFFIRTMMRVRFPSIPLVVVPASELKKYVTGKGNANKEKMVLECYKTWRFEADSNDIVDAFCLAKYLKDKGGKYGIKGSVPTTSRKARTNRTAKTSTKGQKKKGS